MSYYEKYLKYKNKYFKLKNILGGIDDFFFDENQEQVQEQIKEITIDTYTDISNQDLLCSNFYVLSNNLGSCWNHVVQMILFFGDKTSQQINTIISRSDINAEILYENSKKMLKRYFEFNELQRENIINLIDIFINRIQNKTEPPNLKRRNSFQCEEEFISIYQDIFLKKTINISGGDKNDIIALFNFLCIVFFGKTIKVHNVKLSESQNINLRLVNNSIGVIGFTSDHVVSFYNCGRYGVYCNNEFVSYFNYLDLFEKYNNNIDNDYYIVIDDDKLPKLKTDLENINEKQLLSLAILVFE